MSTSTGRLMSCHFGAKLTRGPGYATSSGQLGLGHYVFLAEDDLCDYYNCIRTKQYFFTDRTI